MLVDSMRFFNMVVNLGIGCDYRTTIACDVDGLWPNILVVVGSNLMRSRSGERPRVNTMLHNEVIFRLLLLTLFIKPYNRKYFIFFPRPIFLVLRKM